MQSLGEIRKIVRFCQKNGILKFKDGDFEIELKEIPKKSSAPELTSEPQQPQFPSWESMSPEQRLLWSSTPDNFSG